MYGITKKALPGLGARVKAIRQRRNLTQQVVAVRGGTTTTTICEVERYDLASARTLNCVAKGLGVSVDELTGRKALQSL